MRNRPVSHVNSYALMDMAVTYRFSTRTEGLVQIQNLTDHYRQDLSAGFAAVGRQMKGGMRIRL
jgi:outer membrane receptor for ferric coprogen and ferric-rhodotorulic acid